MGFVFANKRVPCPQAPVFSLFKRCPGSSSAAAAAAACTDEEILLPNYSQNWDTMYRFPWEAKRNAALMRGSLQRTMFENSTRYVCSAQCGMGQSCPVCEDLWCGEH